MSKRSWNNGTRELEEIAGSVILNENLWAAIGKAEQDEKVDRAGRAMGPDSKEKEKEKKKEEEPDEEDAEGIVGDLDDEVDASNEEDDDVTEVVEGIVDRAFDVSDKVIDFVTKPTPYDDKFAKDILAGIKRGSKIANRTIGGVVKGAGEVVKGVAKGIGEVGKGAVQGATEDGENKSLKDEFLEFAEKVSAVDEGRDIDIMVLRSELNRLDDILADKEHAAAQKEM